jgi:hypothetical protein
MKLSTQLSTGLALIVSCGCARVIPIQRATIPLSLTDTLMGLALDSVAASEASRPLLLYTNAADVPAPIFGPERVRFLMRAAPEVDSVLAIRVFTRQPTVRWRGTLSLPRPVRWVNDSLLAYWRSPQGYQEFRRRESGHAVVIAVARPVVDTAGAVAVVYVESLCGPFCDTGRAYIFVRDTHHRWVLKRVALSWQS